MSNEVGVLGQLYEDRKTGKRGVLTGRNDKYKTLMFSAPDGSTFSMCNSTFRSGWRKVTTEDAIPVPTGDTPYMHEHEADTPTTEATEEVSTEPIEEEAPKKEQKPKRKAKAPKVEKEIEEVIKPHYDIQSFSDFVDEVSQHREVRIEEISTNLTRCFIDDIPVIDFESNGDGTLKLSMLPDVHCYSDWGGIENTIHYALNSENHLDVHVRTYFGVTIFDVLGRIVEAVETINLYGYTVEEDEGDEE